MKNWINIETNPPEEDVAIIVTDGDCFCCVEMYDPHRYSYAGDGFYVLGVLQEDVEIIFTPTHWMPIPKFE